MARLLRVHFASIGHRDARLAPLTLDFRHAGHEGPEGRAADTVLWLRNGGGKSSILNLFYSVFRPSSREFLGSSAEGRARRLGDYVDARDLAFVVTEWDVEPADDLELFATAPTEVRLAGQVLAWKGQRRSADVGNLRRLFFSLRAGADAGISFETLPVHGLGEPAESFDAFRQWLRDASHAHRAKEVVYTENQKTWLTHLETIGLDPELFRYQLRMNQREGAADEVFRFTRDADFVRFLLELALEPEIADGVAQNLTAQQENLRRRPVWELERRFVGEAVGATRQLSGAVEAFGAADAQFARTTREVAELSAGLDARAARADDAARVAATEAEAARERGRVASNLRDRTQRWVRGLERLALVYDEAEAREALGAEEAALREVRAELAHARGARARAEVFALEAEERALRDALARERDELEPLRREACARGATLFALLDAEHARVEEARRRLATEGDEATLAADAANERHAAAREERGKVEAEEAAVDAQIDRRDKAREALLRDGVIERREAASEAAARWGRALESRERALDEAKAERARLDAGLAAIGERREGLIAERASAGHRHERLDQRLGEALTWRDRLSADARVREVEEVDAPDLEASGLLDRLVRRAAAARRRLLESRVEGAEDQRSLEWLREHGLLPSPVDVRRVVDALRRGGHSAHAGPAYLEQNLRSAEVAALLSADPACFGGVVVTTRGALEAAAALSIEGLRAPVQVTWVESLVPSEGPPQARVLLPDAALWDRAAADERQAVLAAESARRSERERGFADEEAAFGVLVEELRRYLAAHGDGGLVRLEREVDDAAAALARADAELRELDAERARTREALDAVAAEQDRLRGEREAAVSARAAVAGFIDAHETGIDEARRRKDELGRVLRALAETAERERAEANRQRARAGSLAMRANEEEQAARRIREERDAIAHRESPATAAGPDAPEPRTAESTAEESGAPQQVSLDQARVGYDTARRHYEGELSGSRIRWQLEECERKLSGARTSFERLVRDLDRDRVDALARRSDLRAELERLEEAEAAGVVEVEGRRATHRHAENVLRQQKDRRRDAEDLPADRERPVDAATARATAKALEDEVEEQTRLAAAALEAVREHEARQGGAERLADRCRTKAELLGSNARTAGVELPALPPTVLPDELEAIDRAVEALLVRFVDGHERLNTAREQAERAARGVHEIANRTEFASLEAQYRERMKDPVERLFPAAAELGDRLASRLAILEDSLAKLDEDRRLIVEELLHLADEVSTLLRRAESSSRLPPSLEGWGGRSYLRIAFTFPDRDDERRARLEPLVDRLVGQANLPGGLELVLATATELAGPRGFDVKILKPDTVLRPEPVALSAMSTFSRGQQLTAAILLYCTMVQLRARTRGRSRSAEDAGVLILDNPIGTCSNVALLRLQRMIAARMRVQLVYTTGVDDLEALATLPNKIRLRNSHRDRATGHYHVTDEAAEERGQVEGVRLLEVPAR